MTEPKLLQTIDFVTHSQVEIAAPANAIWPHIVDLSAWRSDGQCLKPIGGDVGQEGQRFVAVAAHDPDVPLYYAENAEMLPPQRRTIRLETLDIEFLGFASWSLTRSGNRTVVSYDTYCRGPMLPFGMSKPELMAGLQQRMDGSLSRLKAFIEG